MLSNHIYLIYHDNIISLNISSHRQFSFSHCLVNKGQTGNITSYEEYVLLIRQSHIFSMWCDTISCWLVQVPLMTDDFWNQARVIYVLLIWSSQSYHWYDHLLSTSRLFRTSGLQDLYTIVLWSFDTKHLGSPSGGASGATLMFKGHITLFCLYWYHWRMLQSNCHIALSYPKWRKEEEGQKAATWPALLRRR